MIKDSQTDTKKGTTHVDHFGFVRADGDKYPNIFIRLYLSAREKLLIKLK